MQAKNESLKAAIDQLVESHPELETVVNGVAMKRPANASPEQVQANLQEQARAIIEAEPELEGVFEE